MIKNILITGGNGFISKNLKEHFQSKYQIYTPNSEELNVCLLRDLETFIEIYQIDLIIHTAHYNQKRRDANPDLEVEINLRMFLNIHKVALKVKKVLYFGSGAEYDKREDLIQVTEEQFGNSIPDTPYGISKYVTNLISSGAQNIYNLRIFGLFGKYEDWKTYFISNLCCKAMLGLPLNIRQDCYFDYLYLEDFFNIVQWFIEYSPKHHDYNVCSGRRYLLSDLALCIREISGRTDLPIIIDKEGLNREYTGSNNRLKSEMKNFEAEPIENSITKLYTWYLGQSEHINVEVLKSTK